jgi:hypothetical protein
MGAGKVREVTGTSLLFGSILIAACSQAGTSSSMTEPRLLRVTTERTVYAAGDSVRLTFENISGSELLLNTCLGDLELQAGADWQRVSAAAGTGGCRNDLRALSRGSFVTDSLSLLASLRAGVYRFRFTSVFDSNSVALQDIERTSNVFRVS